MDFYWVSNGCSQPVYGCVRGPVGQARWGPALAASAAAFPSSQRACKSPAELSRMSLLAFLKWSLRSKIQIISHWENNPLVLRRSRSHVACCQVSWPCSRPWICLSQGGSSSSRISSGSPHLSLKEKAKCLPLSLQMHHHIRVTGCYWPGAWFRAYQILLSRPWTGGKSPQASLLHPANPFPEYLPRPGNIDHLFLQRQLWPPATLHLDLGTSALSTKLSL